MHSKRTQRTGFTLIDSVSMMIIIGLILSLAVTILKTSFGVQSEAAKYLIDSTKYETAHQRFLNDVHEAVGVAIEDESQFSFLEAEIERPPSPDRMNSNSARHVLVLDFDEQQVVYRVMGNTMQRCVVSEQALAGREDWQFAEVASCSWQLIEGRVSLVRCEVEFERNTHTPIFWQARCLSLPIMPSEVSDPSGERDEP